MIPSSPKESAGKAYVPGYSLAVALLCRRNIWVGVAVVRDRRRCAQHFSPEARNKIEALLFCTPANTTFLGCALVVVDRVGG